jgi:ABC-type phosphate transport system permease subunit
MIVALAAGSTPKLTFNPLESIQTMTASRNYSLQNYIRCRHSSFSYHTRAQRSRSNRYA